MGSLLSGLTVSPSFMPGISFRGMPSRAACQAKLHATGLMILDLTNGNSSGATIMGRRARVRGSDQDGRRARPTRKSRGSYKRAKASGRRDAVGEAWGKAAERRFLWKNADSGMHQQTARAIVMLARRGRIAIMRARLAARQGTVNACFRLTDAGGGEVGTRGARVQARGLRGHAPHVQSVDGQPQLGKAGKEHPAKPYGPRPVASIPATIEETALADHSHVMPLVQGVDLELASFLAGASSNIYSFSMTGAC